MAIQKKHVESGRMEQSSLHPVIDFEKCMGCAACVAACPERDVLGIINRKAVLIAPLSCIGHGACKAACPFNAITLVFGTEKRGADIPVLQPNFETNIAGIFIAGELGSMGVIRNAIEQGRLAMEAIAEKIVKAAKTIGVHDVIVVGAGPAGFSATLQALALKLDYVTLEQESLGGMVARYPKDKVIVTHSVVMPLLGKVNFKETNKEELLKFWQEAEISTGVKINYFERVEKVVHEEKYLTVVTQKNTYKTQAVLLAIGRRLTSRKLCVPGEEKAKVVYRLDNPLQYQSQHILVVGGGDSALEAAVTLAVTAGTTVTLSYRGEVFSGVKQKNLQEVHAAWKKGSLNILLDSTVQEIKDSEVYLDRAEEKIVLKNDTVVVCGGGVLPIPFVKEIGIKVETKYGTQ